MGKYNIKNNMTIPNMLSLIRIILIVPFINFFLNDDYLSATIVIALSGLSDMFDGMIARKFNQISALGAILDPIADKLTLIAIVICLVVKFPILSPLCVVMIIKEIIMLFCGSHLLKLKITPPSSNWYGKLSTIIFYVSVVVIVALQAIWNYNNDTLNIILMSVTLVSMLYTLYRYAKIYFELIKQNKKTN